jgi:hypothetical protein
MSYKRWDLLIGCIRKRFLMINLDKKYTDYVLSKTDVFKHIHPNVLLVLGLLMKFFSG